MPETFVMLLTAHLLGDFVLQTDWIMRNKQRIGGLLVHVGIVTLLSWLLLGSWHWPILLAIFLSHLALDKLKSTFFADTIKPFLVDQLLHVGVLTWLAWYFPRAVSDSWILALLNPVEEQWYFAVLSFLSGLILIVPAGGFLVGKATRPFIDELQGEQIDGLQKGGQYIGWLERSLVMLLLLIHQPNGIGFLIAAKSILRFGEIKNAEQRKVAEYIIIGTFLSFGWGLLVAVLMQKAIGHWLLSL